MREKEDFQNWNIQKIKIDGSGKNKLYRTRDIWWCDLGVNVGFEQDGTGKNNGRPILVLKGLSKHTCLVIPLTTSNQKHSMRITLGKINGKDALGVISQVRVIDTKRFVNKLGKLNKEKFEKIRKAVRDLI